MADAKITALTAIDALVSADLFPVVDDVAGTPTTKKATAQQVADFVLDSSRFKADFVDGAYHDNDGNSYASFALWLAAVSGTFTRGGSDHRYINSSGYLANGSADTLRIEYDPLTLRAIGAVIEPAATNLLRYSNVLTNSVWAFSNTGVNRAINAATGVSGTADACTLLEDSSNGSHIMYAYDGSASLAAATPHTYSFYCKSIGGRGLNLVPVGASGLPQGYVYPDQLRATGGWHIEPHQDGVVRVWASGTSGGGGALSIQFKLANVNSISYQGDGTSGMVIERFQCEEVATEGDPPTSYIDNSAGTQNTRSADALAFTVPADTFYSVYGTGDYDSEALSAGAHSVVPVPTNLILRRISNTPPDATVANKTVNARVEQADVVGLGPDAGPSFTSLYLDTCDILSEDGWGIFCNNNAIFQWTTGLYGLPPGRRAIVIGHTPSSAVSNSVCIGNDAGKNATTFNTSTVINDTAAGAATSISGSEVIGNEAGNGLSSISGCIIIGNAAGAASGSAGSSVVVGHQASRSNTAIDTVAIGAYAGQSASSGSLTNCVIIGSSAGNTVTGNRTGLVLIGYNIEPPSATTDDYLSVVDVYRGIPSTQSAHVGKPSLATNATSGFIYVPACAGTPTGTPTAVTGMVPIVVDSTNNKLYFFSNGAWRDAGP